MYIEYRVKCDYNDFSLQREPQFLIHISKEASSLDPKRS